MSNERRGNNDHGRGETPPLTPFLLTPYTATDDGTRPLPSSIPSWICPSIHLNGVPYTGVSLTAGVQVNLSVVVKNRGALSAVVTVRLYYADPTTVFTPLSTNLIGQKVYLVGAGATTQSPVMPWTPPGTIPSHICLLAEATCSPDPSIGTFDVVNDRHYGQQNVNILVVQNSQKTSFEFFAGNPGREAAEFSVRAHPVEAEALRQLEKLYNAEAIELNPKALALRVVEPGQRQRVRQEISLKLKPQERRLCQLMMDVPPDLGSHQFFAVELEQLADEDSEQTAAKQDKERYESPKIGSIGVIAFGKQTGG